MNHSEQDKRFEVNVLKLKGFGCQSTLIHRSYRIHESLLPIIVSLLHIFSLQSVKSSHQAGESSCDSL